MSIHLLSSINGGELFNNLFENIISLDLPSLNVIFHVWAQTDILSKSLLGCSAVSA